ncbi:GNAT family N-acetyltransferase [Streptomyces anulatus]|uniref:GNAT family N-acetyltransferase n=1 Tax=Streptomyces anulatus TaxID=1892 RepID=UPI00386CEC9D
MRVWGNLAMLAHQRKEHRRAHHLAAITFNLNQASHDAEATAHRALATCQLELAQLRQEEEEVAQSLDLIVDQLAAGTSRLVTAHVEDHLVGWLHLRREPSALTGHWGSVAHVQSDPLFRRRGIGAAPMNEARRIARDEMGLRQLHLAARGGAGLEHF